VIDFKKYQELNNKVEEAWKAALDEERGFEWPTFIDESLIPRMPAMGCCGTVEDFDAGLQEHLHKHRRYDPACNTARILVTRIEATDLSGSTVEECALLMHFIKVILRVAGNHKIYPRSWPLLGRRVTKVVEILESAYWRNRANTETTAA